MLKKISFFAVIALSAGGYIPILIGGFIQPSEVNLATYELWTIIVSLMLYSSIQQKQEWILPFAWAIGNISTIVILFAFPRKWMFNLGDAESVALYGIVIVVGTWATVGGITKHWNPRILFLGSVAVDVASFYPVIKQYLLPHALPTEFLLLGGRCSFWALSSTWFLSMSLSAKLSERRKIFGRWLKNQHFRWKTFSFFR